MGFSLTRLPNQWLRPAWAMAGAALVLTALVAGPAFAPKDNALLTREKARFASRDLSNAGLVKVAATMDPAMRALALRHDPASRTPDQWARPEGWNALDMVHVPNLGFAETDGANAQELNALRPFATLPIRPMRPFVLKASGEDRRRAVECLTQAVYYEAAR